MKPGWLALTVMVFGATQAAGQEIPGKDVTIPPKAIKAVKAVYTEAARAAGIEGTVRLDVIVLADGSVGSGANDVKVVQSLDPKLGLDDQAVSASKQWKFKPATKDGKPIAVHVVIEHTFSLRSK